MNMINFFENKYSAGHGKGWDLGGIKLCLSLSYFAAVYLYHIG
jgi:hypothetical protein